MLINRTRLKEIVGNIQISKGFTEELEKQVEEIVHKSCKRAMENNRTTVMKKDL